ncbi:CvpA family protein [Parablautia sp. Marseille-Q6255]|uniref:CvpA family protein n=1 Tax=Parablautia sp. Marseille-Q6255 TaxID=3039593 RepID=UPI0024BC308B|nr:CvpA family protein [Parablautia sp. Marseille-Q6255]
MNILEIAVLILIAGFALAGWRRGFVRKLASMLSLVVSIVLVSVFLPYMTEFLKTDTPVYEYIVKQCREVVTENLSGVLTAGSFEGGSQENKDAGAADSYRDMGREEIKALMEQYGYDSSIVDALSDEQLEEYKEKYIEQYVQQYFGGGDGAPTGEMTKIEQTELIEHLPIPEALRELLLNYNNDEGYSSLGVSSFQDYLIHFIATMILNVIAFVSAVILVQILLHVAITALDILAHIPLIGGVNRLLGLLLGCIQALFFLWLFFLILSMMSATQWGMQLMDMVQSSQALSSLYDSNLFLQIVVRTAAMFV